MGDADKPLGAGGDVGPSQVGNTIFGDDVLHVVAQRGNRAAGCQRRHDFRHRAFLGVGHAGNGNKTASALRMLYAADEIELPAARGILARADAFGTHLPG